MSPPSPAWPRRDEPPRCGTAASPPAASSDSDSGCALEEYPDPPEVPVRSAARSSQPAPVVSGSGLRAKALLQQLPPQDCDERYCPGLAEEERRRLQAFSARRRREALGQGLACPVPGPCHGCPCKKCGRRLNRGDPGVSASGLGDELWHPSCFCCHFCHQPLVDLIYFQQDGRIYCGRHHAELFRPRCASCDQLIFLDECIEAEGRRWHPQHFCCLECEVPLRGQRYVLASGRPCCRRCFESLYAEPCQACGEPIGADSEEATHQGLRWHARAACFCCSRCRKPLRGQPLTARRSLLYCSEACSRQRDTDDDDTLAPDSPPVSRAGPATPSTSPAPVAGGCGRRVQGAELELLLDEAPVHPAFRSADDRGAAAEERSGDVGMQPGAEGPGGPGAQGHPAAGSPDAGTPRGDRDLRCPGGLSPARPSPRPGDAELQDGTEEEDSWCPTCSSSSDSDEEGFFFGKPIPRPGMSPPGRERRGPGWAGGRPARPRGGSRHCSVS